MSTNVDKKPSEHRSATQRLTDAENAIMSLFNVFDRMSKDMVTFREALKLLHNKVDSIVKASVAGEPINDKILERIMTENAVAELASKVENMVRTGLVIPEQYVSDNSFLVGQEFDDEGTLVNSRLQFALKTLPEELQLKLLGQKTGELLALQEGKLKFKLLESYKINEPQPPPPPAPEEPQLVPDTEVAQPQ